MSGDLWVVRESGAEVQVEWRIERFLSLSGKPALFSLHSPPFSLSDAQWFLEMWPNDCGFIKLGLHKRFSTSRTHSLKYTLGIRSTDGSVYESTDEEDEFQKHGAGGLPLSVRVSKPRGSRNVLSADGALTVFATLRLDEPTLLEEDNPQTLPLRSTHTEEVCSEWKVEGFASLPLEKDFSLKSPAFWFAGAEWCLRVYPCVSIFLCRGWVSLLLRRERSSSEEQTVAYTLGIRRRNGNPYRLHHGEKEFGTGDQWGCWSFIKPSELLDSSNGPVHQGSVTFFCSLRADTTATPMERATPTSSNPSHEEKASQTTPSEEEEASAHSSVKNMLEQLKRLVLNGQHADVTFKVNDQTFPAHRVILTTRSPVFFGMFENDTEEKRTGVVTITDFQPDTVRVLLSFLYTGDVSVVTSGNAVEMFKVAHKYDIQDLKEAALRCMRRDLSAGAFFGVFVLASVYDERELTRAASAFFVENAGSILAAPGWLPFMQDHTVLANELLQQLRGKKL